MEASRPAGQRDGDRRVRQAAFQQIISTGSGAVAIPELG